MCPVCVMPYMCADGERKSSSLSPGFVINSDSLRRNSNVQLRSCNSLACFGVDLPRQLFNNCQLFISVVSQFFGCQFRMKSGDTVVKYCLYFTSNVLLLFSAVSRQLEVKTVDCM